MKILTVKRALEMNNFNKTISIFYSDVNGDEMLNGILCRKACTLKSGEERTFDIADHEAKIFAVIDDQYNKIIIAEYSVNSNLNFIKFKLKSNPNSKNGFEYIFAEQKVRTRKFSSKFIGALCGGLIVSFILFLFTIYYFGDVIYLHFLSKSKVPKDFETGEYSITLSKAFEQDYQNKNYYAVYYTPDPCLVYVGKEDLEKAPQLQDISLREYCLLLMEVNNDSHLSISEKDGMMYYVDEVMGQALGKDERFICYTYVYKTDDAFWFVQFFSTADRSYYWEDCYHEWAKSMKFN